MRTMLVTMVFLAGCGIAPSGSGGTTTTSSATSTETASGGGGSGGTTAAGGGDDGGSTASSGGTGGDGGSGGCAADPYVCGPKDCGLVANPCGVYTNCDTGTGQDGLPITCKSESGTADSNGPMVCNHDTHQCECPPAPPETQVLCDGPDSLVKGLCEPIGGCIASLCGDSPVPKYPEACIGSGAFAQDGTFIWCCAKPCDASADCNDSNECTTDTCGPAHFCVFASGPQTACNNGAGICVDGACINQ